ncbi:MAG: lipoyl(octanoyl) transferase LipB [Gemmatimonadaceae bacterium]
MTSAARRATGRRSYGRRSSAYQVAQEVIAGRIDGDVLLLLEHPPVVTLGRSSKEANLVASPAFLASRGVELFEVERGGDVTFHGPGQLVGYPIMDLKAAPHRKDLHWYLRQVEEAMIRALASWNVRGLRSEGYTGVWVGDAGNEPNVPRRKIASIGVHARDWVTWHGFAINISTDLSYFDLMIPCGISGVTMTSLEREIAPNGRPTVESFSDDIVHAFAAVFQLAPRLDTTESLPAIARA